MPFEVRDSDDGVGTIITGSGVVTEIEYVDTLKKHLTQNKANLKRYKYSLADYTAVTDVAVSYDAIKMIADLCIRTSIDNPGVVVAVVSNQALTYGLSRMSQMLMDETGWEHMVFHNREEAESWIKERVREKHGVSNLTIGSTS